MSRRAFSVLLAAALGIFTLSAVTIPGYAQSSTLTILHVNDTHSTLFPFGPHAQFGGIARMATLIKERRAAAGASVLAFHAGDVFVGTFEFNKYLGYPELKITEGLYDALGLGNHEFDLGFEPLAGILSGAMGNQGPVAVPILCANLDTTDLPLAALVQKRIKKKVGGLTVGITAVVNAEPQNYSSEVAARLSDPYQAAGVQAATLRGQGCQVVVCISHLGKTADVMGLSQVPGIDIVIGGHSHDALPQPIAAGGKVIVQAGEFGKFLGELKVEVAGGTAKLVSYALYPVNRDVQEDATLVPLLNALRDGIVNDPRFGPVYTKLVAWAERDLDRRWVEAEPERDTGLGNLVTDALRKGVHGYGFPADISLEANGYLAAKILAGKVVGNDIMRAVPYGYDQASGLGFKVHCVLIAGAQLLAGLEYSLTYVEYTDEISMQVSGLTFRYDSRNPPSSQLGQLSRLDPTSVFIQGQPVDPQGLYWVALNEQLYKSLVTLGLQPFNHIETGLFEYNLVKSFMQKLNQVDYEPEGRILDRKYKAAGDMR